MAEIPSSREYENGRQRYIAGSARPTGRRATAARPPRPDPARNNERLAEQTPNFAPWIIGVIAVVIVMMVIL